MKEQLLPTSLQVVDLKVLNPAAVSALWLSPQSSEWGFYPSYFCTFSDQIYWHDLVFCLSDATPRIIGPRNELIKMIEGHRAFLDCRFFGSPVPELRW